MRGDHYLVNCTVYSPGMRKKSDSSHFFFFISFHEGERLEFPRARRPMRLKKGNKSSRNMYHQVESISYTIQHFYSGLLWNTLYLWCFEWKQYLNVVFRGLQLIQNIATSLLGFRLRAQILNQNVTADCLNIMSRSRQLKTILYHTLQYNILI